MNGFNLCPYNLGPARFSGGGSGSGVQDLAAAATAAGRALPLFISPA